MRRIETRISVGARSWMTENFIHIFAWHLEVLCASAGRVHRNEPRPHKVLCNNKRLSRTLQKVERHCDIFSVYTHASENNSSNILRNSSHILVESKSSNQNIIIKTHLKTSIPFSFCGFVLQHIRSQQCRGSKKTATMPPKTCSLYTYREAVEPPWRNPTAFRLGLLRMRKGSADWE